MQRYRLQEHGPGTDIEIASSRRANMRGLPRLSIGVGRGVLAWCVAATIGMLLAGGDAKAIQSVWVDFDTYTTPGSPGEEDDYVYSPAERAAVVDILHELFFTSPDDPSGGAFGIDFLDTAPPPFTSTLVKINEGVGHSEKIDFRNLDDDDDVEIHAVRTLKLFEGTAKPPELGGGTWTEAELLTSPNIIMATANLAAHELGHSFGLRHHDAFTPIGTGIGVAGTRYTPTYLGGDGTNTSSHILALNSAVSLSAETVLTPSWFSPRSALKMTLNKIEDEPGDNPFVSSEIDDFGGDVGDDPSIAAPIPLMALTIPNTTRPPDPFGIDPADPTAPGSGPETFPAAASVVTGRLEDKSDMFTVDLDYYSFFGPEGARVTVEIISHILSEGDGRISDPVDPHVELLDATLAPLPYPAASVVGMAALNDDQFESTDSILFDVVLPASGVYYVEVRPSIMKLDADVVGDYELLVYGIAEVDPPLPGDYNDNGVVDAADYTAWQDHLGAPAGTLPNDVDGGVIGEAQYDTWVANFGMTGGSGATTNRTVPEPATAGMLSVGLLLAAAGVAFSQRRSSTRRAAAR